MDEVTTYVAGVGVLLGSGDRWLLLDRAPDARVLERWFDLLRGPGPGPDAVLAELARDHADASWAYVDNAPSRPRHLTAGHGREVDGRLDVGLTGTGAALPLTGGVVRAATATVPAPVARPVSIPGLIDGIPPEILAGGRPAADTGPPLAPVAPARVDRTTVRPQPAAPVAPVAPVEPDHDGHTTLRGASAHLRQPTHETVLAAHCLNGHPTPTHSTGCRVCGAPVPPQDPQRVPRPVLGRLLLPGGEWVSLDREVVFGRKPAPLPGGEPWPHLVALPEESTYLSRNHLQIQLDGWLVLARDLGSQGGTTLHQPGRAPERIRAHEPHALGPGSRLDLADVFEIVFEVTP